MALTYNTKLGRYENNGQPVAAPAAAGQASPTPQSAASATQGVESSQGYTLGPNGQYAPTAATARKQKVQDIGNDQEQRLFGTLNGALSGLSSWSGSANLPAGGVSAGPNVTYGGSPMDNSAVNSAASAQQNAAFGAAKSKAGAMGRSALQGLDSEMAARGISGSGTQGRGLVDRLAAATNPLSDVNVAQLGENTNIAQHNQDLGATAAGQQFQGGIAERGQNLAAAEDSAQLAQTAALAKRQMLMQALSGLTGRLNVGLSY